MLGVLYGCDRLPIDRSLTLYSRRVDVVYMRVVYSNRTPSGLDEDFLDPALLLPGRVFHVKRHGYALTPSVGRCSTKPSGRSEVFSC